MYNGPGSRPYDPVTNRFNLQYVQNLGVNWLWFQPIHPIGIDGRQTDPNTGQPYAVGSPYSVKNFFQVNPLLSKANTRDAAMQEFTNFVAAADAAGVNVMLDDAVQPHAPVTANWTPAAPITSRRTAQSDGLNRERRGAVLFARPANMTSAPPAPATWRRRRTAMTSANGRTWPDILLWPLRRAGGRTRRNRAIT